MKANEIRIGIHIIDVFNPNNPIERQIDFDDLAMLENYKNHPLPFKPILLTEEWLLKFGFEKKLNCSNMIYYILAGKCLLEYNLTHNIADIVRKLHLDLFIDIKYVHQLQNLYFALTNEELTLKQK